jgi:Lar family restriction alleviation protein
MKSNTQKKKRKKNPTTEKIKPYVYELSVTEKPLPCPFCGKKPISNPVFYSEVYGDYYYTIECDSKKCEINSYIEVSGQSKNEAKKEAIKAWNKRA